MVGDGIVGKRVEFSGMDVGLDPAIPYFGVELAEPLAKSGEFFVRESEFRFRVSRPYPCQKYNNDKCRQNGCLSYPSARSLRWSASFSRRSVFTSMRDEESREVALRYASSNSRMVFGFS